MLLNITKKMGGNDRLLDIQNSYSPKFVVKSKIC